MSEKVWTKHDLGVAHGMGYEACRNREDFQENYFDARALQDQWEAGFIQRANEEADKFVRAYWWKDGSGFDHFGTGTAI